MQDPARSLRAVRDRDDGSADAAVDTFDLLRRWKRFVTIRELSEDTINAYGYHLVRFVWATLRPIEDATEDDLLDYLEGFAGKGPTRGMVIRAFKSFYGWAFEGELIPRNPARRIKVTRPKYGPAPYLDPEEITRLIVAAAWREPRRAWAIMLMYATGIRLGSAVNILLEDIRDGRLHVRVAKGGRPYSIPLNRMAQEAADELTTLALERSGLPIDLDRPFGGGGHRPFGYERDRVTLRESEVTEIRAAVRSLLDGVSLRAVVLRWNRGGITTTTGGQWVAQTARVVLTSPRIAGLREHQGTVAGPAAWPAIISEADHDRIEAILHPIGRETTRTVPTGAGRRGQPTQPGRLLGVQEGRLWDWIHQAGIDSEQKVNPHELRHSFATRLAEKQVHPRTIQELMNHQDMSQLTRYITVADPTKRSAVDLLDEDF